MEYFEPLPVRRDGDDTAPLVLVEGHRLHTRGLGRGEEAQHTSAAELVTTDKKYLILGQDRQKMDTAAAKLHPKEILRDFIFDLGVFYLESHGGPEILSLYYQTSSPGAAKSCHMKTINRIPRTPLREYGMNQPVA